jgi:hypothetical protein
MIDTKSVGAHQIQFGKGEATSLGVVNVPTPLGTISFHVVSATTPFLYCLQDIDRMGVRFDNLNNLLIQDHTDTVVPVIHKWGHPFMLLNESERSLAFSHLTESQLR